MDGERARLFHILSRFRVGTLVTRADGFVHTQPLAIAAIDQGEEEIVFVTVGDSEAARDVAQSADAVVIFQDGRHCASWMGTAYLTHDAWRVRRLWREDMRIWFPRGPEDERLVLLSVHGRAGEYWDVSRARRTRARLRQLGRALDGAESDDDGPTMPEHHAFVRISPHDDSAAVDGPTSPSRWR